MSNLNQCQRARPPTHLHRFDANSVKIPYVSDHKVLIWSKSIFYHKGYGKYKLFDLTDFISVLPTFWLIEQSSSRTRYLIVWFQSAAPKSQIHQLFMTPLVLGTWEKTVNSDLKYTYKKQWQLKQWNKESLAKRFPIRMIWSVAKNLNSHVKFPSSHYTNHFDRHTYF